MRTNSASKMSATVEIHNTLARRAEIGALVEEMCRNGSPRRPAENISFETRGRSRAGFACGVFGVRNGEGGDPPRSPPRPRQGGER